VTDYYGKPLEDPMGQLAERFCRGELLAKILEMPCLRPLSYSDAMLMLNQRLCETWKNNDLGHSPGQSQWYWRNFVEFISAQGFHIELTGDEFELWHPPRVDS
jgi:hypothetical protein